MLIQLPLTRDSLQMTLEMFLYRVELTILLPGRPAEEAEFRGLPLLMNTNPISFAPGEVNQVRMAAARNYIFLCASQSRADAELMCKLHLVPTLDARNTTVEVWIQAQHAVLVVPNPTSITNAIAAKLQIIPFKE